MHRYNHWARESALVSGSGLEYQSNYILNFTHTDKCILLNILKGCLAYKFFWKPAVEFWAGTWISLSIVIQVRGTTHKKDSSYFYRIWRKFGESHPKKRAETRKKSNETRKEQSQSHFLNNRKCFTFTSTIAFLFVCFPGKKHLLE